MSRLRRQSRARHPPPGPGARSLLSPLPTSLVHRFTPGVTPKVWTACGIAVSTRPGRGSQPEIDERPPQEIEGRDGAVLPDALPIARHMELAGHRFGPGEGEAHED